MLVPLVLIGVGLVIAILGGYAAVSGFDRFEQAHPDEPTPPAERLLAEQPRVYLLPFGAVTCIGMVSVGLVWLILRAAF